VASRSFHPQGSLRGCIRQSLNRLLPIAILGGVSLAAALAVPRNRLWYGSIRSGQARSPADRPAAPESRRLGQSPDADRGHEVWPQRGWNCTPRCRPDIANLGAGGEG
jgi:hypothetical protein